MKLDVGRLTGPLSSLSPALVGLALLALVSAPVLSPSTASLTSQAPGGLSTFADAARQTGYDVQMAAINPTQATGWAKESTLILVPEAHARFLPPAADALAAWRDEGGALWVADGQGGAIPLFSALGVPVSPTRILDASLAGEPTKVPAEVSIDGETFQVRLEQPFPIDREAIGETTWMPAAETRDSSFVDLNGNERLDTSDPRGPYVVGVSANGPHVVFTGGGLLSNEAVGEEGTRAAVDGLLSSLLPDGGTVVVDTSHAEHGPLGDASLFVLRPALAILTSSLWGSLAILALSGGTGLWLYQRSRSVSDEAEDRLEPHEVAREEASLDVGFMSKVLDSMTEDSGPGGVPERYRGLLDAIHETETMNGSPEE